jgi:hypothetical protein
VHRQHAVSSLLACWSWAVHCNLLLRAGAAKQFICRPAVLVAGLCIADNLPRVAPRPCEQLAVPDKYWAYDFSAQLLLISPSAAGQPPSMSSARSQFPKRSILAAGRQLFVSAAERILRSKWPSVVKLPSTLEPVRLARLQFPSRVDNAGVQ